MVVKIKEKIYDILKIKKEEAKAAKVEDKKGRYAAVLKKLGIDLDLIKSNIRENVSELVQFGFFDSNRFEMIFSDNNELREPTKFDKMRRDFTAWRRERIYQIYGFYKSDDVQERIARFKNIFWSSTDNLQQGLVKYKKMAFWWRTEDTSYFANSRFRKFWNFRQAQKQGVLDFYMTTMLIVGGSVILIGVYKGLRRSNKNGGYQEQINQIKLEEVALEMQRLQLLIEIDLLEQEEEQQREKRKKRKAQRQQKQIENLNESQSQISSLQQTAQ